MKDLTAHILSKMKKQKNKSSYINLYPNCSEMVFKLTGDLEEIRQEMYNLLEWTKMEMEYTGEVGEGPKTRLTKGMKKRIEEVKKQIKEAKNLDDFEQIVIEFTCNYETFFKKEDNDLLVATCNNYNWENVNYEEHAGDYYGVAGFTYYALAGNVNGYEVYHRKYDEGMEDRRMPEWVFPEAGFKIFGDGGKLLKQGEDTKFVLRNDICFIIRNNRLEKIPLVQDEKILTKLKLLANLEGFKNKNN